jgi:hypothetical protein
VRFGADDLLDAVLLALGDSNKPATSAAGGVSRAA